MSRKAERRRAEGHSREYPQEVEQLIREAVVFHLDALRASGEPVPEPAAVGTTRVEVPAA